MLEKIRWTDILVMTYIGDILVIFSDNSGDE